MLQLFLVLALLCVTGCSESASTADRKLDSLATRILGFTEPLGSSEAVDRRIVAERFPVGRPVGKIEEELMAIVTQHPKKARFHRISTNGNLELEIFRASHRNGDVWEDSFSIIFIQNPEGIYERASITWMHCIPKKNA